MQDTPLIVWIGALAGGFIFLCISVVVLLIIRELFKRHGNSQNVVGTQPVTVAVAPNATTSPAPTTTPVATQPVVASSTSNINQSINHGFWFYVLIVATALALALVPAAVLIQKLFTGSATWWDFKIESAALIGGILLCVISTVWFYQNPRTWATKTWGWITAVFAAILLVWGMWHLFLGGWYRTSIRKIKEAQGLDVDLSMHWFEEFKIWTSENWMWVGGILLFAALITVMFSKDGQKEFAKLIRVVAIIAAIAFAAHFLDVKNWFSGSNRDKVVATIQTKEGQTRVELTSAGWTRIKYPPGYNWEMAITGKVCAEGKLEERPLTMECKKGNSPIFEFEPEADPTLPGMPIGREALLVRIKLPPEMEGVIKTDFTIITWKVH